MKKKNLWASLFLFLIALYTNKAIAATFTVNDTSDVVDSSPGDGYCDTDSVLDNSPCTLRAALMEANSDATRDEIIIPAGTYTLSLAISIYSDDAGADLDISQPVILTGAGAGVTIIDANGIDRVLEIYRDAVNSKLQGITFTGGYLVGDYGGGISSYPDNMVIENCEITGNTIVQDTDAAIGGGLYLEGNTAALKNVSITYNKLIAASTATTFKLYGGGAMISLSGQRAPLLLENIAISYNEIDATQLPGAYTGGGGLYLDSYLVASIFKNIKIKGNTITGDGHVYGGGLYTKSVNQSSYSNIDISDNTINFSDGEAFGGGWYGDYEGLNTYTNIRANNNSIKAGTAFGGAINFDYSINNTFRNVEMIGQEVVAFATSNYSGEANGGAFYLPQSLSNSFEDIIISDTTLTADDTTTGYAFYLNKANQSSINGLEISDNVATVINNSTGNFINGGFSITHCHDLSIENVRITRNEIEGDLMAEGIYLEDSDRSTFNNIEISYNKNIHASNTGLYSQFGDMIYQYGSDQIDWSHVVIFKNDKANSTSRDNSALFYISHSYDVDILNSGIASNNVTTADNTLAMHVTNSESVRMEYLNISGNNSRGLKIEGLKNSSVKNSSFKNNHSGLIDSFSLGGGLIIERTSSVITRHLDISGNVMEGNDATGSDDIEGAGLYSIDSTFTLDESSVTGNQLIPHCGGAHGAGIALDSRKVTEDNPASIVTIKNSTVSNNKITLIDQSENSDCQSPASIVLGGGIYSKIATIIEQSTIASNMIFIEHNTPWLYGYGGGIYFYGECSEVDLQENCIETVPTQLSIFSSTIANNTIDDMTPFGMKKVHGIGGGLYNYTRSNAPKAKLNNTLLADNTADASPDCYGDWVSAGYNLVSNMTDCSAQLSRTDYAGSHYLDAKLMPLTDNGGSTETVALQSGSLAIDNGDPACADHSGIPFTEDQRGAGFSRPKDGDLNGTIKCDIGAFEAREVKEEVKHGPFSENLKPTY